MLSIRDVKTFQADHFDWEGKRLVVDGDFGPKTAWSYAISGIDIPRRAAIRRATSEVGLTEGIGNRGQKVDGWNQRCGVALGSPWCASSCSYFISVLGAEDVRIAGAIRLGMHFPLVEDGTPARAGDLVFFDTDGDAGDKGHIGLAICDEWRGEIAVVEGNHQNRVAVVRRRREEVLVSRPFPHATGGPVPMPMKADGTHALKLVHVSIAGTR
jgi:hypothetical protein